MRGNLNTIHRVFTLEEFGQIAAHHGLITDEERADCDPFALIAKHYHLAAENELPDSDEGAILWWAFAANMALAKLESGFTMGDLRQAIQSAKDAEEARDTNLYGLNEQKGGSFESIAKFAALHFKDADDPFVLPPVDAIRTGEGAVLKVGDEVICTDFHKYEQMECKLIKKHPYDELMDTSELERLHGSTGFEIPSLETLCIRKLHEADAEFARGETTRQ